MNNRTFAERVNESASQYDRILAEHGEMTPAQEFKHHLHLLTCYWRRLVGFSRMDTLDLNVLVQSYLGAAIQVGSERVHRLIGPDHLIHDLWQEYWWRTTTLLHKRPTTLELVETAHRSFEACLSALDDDPWTEHP
ncbi:hypothetical protein [Roseimicrobium sp. ORNL1]|uniref:hypothetical protein n=1 Tax=Roseimicrobium sp. ORNL1 TaxID=2711231 RepID=UPI0013E1961C|nr:hypothetical protein [Roseimicrobium sp. ORNL1]QIF01786.1 hypothetical protein G5S37_09690 [Roseimicrobium sp. ORNL1]